MENFDFGPGRTLEHVGAVNNGFDVQSLMGKQGFSQVIRDRSSARKRRVVEAARLMYDVMHGREESWMLREAMMPSHEGKLRLVMEQYPGLFPNGQGLGLRETMSYSDYSALTVDILDRLLYGYYTSAPTTTKVLTKVRPLRDFRVVARYEMDGAVTPFTRVPSDTTLKPHAAGEPPTERAMQQAALEVEGSTQRVTYQPQLYQGMMSVNWRAFINDDLGIFADQTKRLAISGNRTISTFITGLYMSSTGPSTTLFNSTFGNQITIANGASSTNPPLSFQGISDALTILQRMKDLDGQPIQFDGNIYLVYGPSLHTTAMNLIKSVKADVSVLGGNQNSQGFPTNRITVENWMSSDMIPVQDKWIPIVCTTSGVKDTTWGLVYDPNVQARPCIELGFLTGYETPQIFQEVPNTMRVGGGVDPSLGNFYTMDQNLKGCLVLGGSPIDGRSFCISTGQGV
jgi:hypothetical protein